MAKSKYYTHVEPKLDEVYQWACNGLQDFEIYKNLNIGKNTYYQYQNQHEEFKDLLTRARTTAEVTVENELFKMCRGYPYWEEVCVKVKKKEYSEDGQVIKEYETLEKKSVQKYSPANFSAVQFYLINKAKQNWASNPHNNDLKKEELEFKKQHEDMKEW